MRRNNLLISASISWNVSVASSSATLALHNFFHDTVTALNSSHQHQQVERQLLYLLFRMLLILGIEEPIMRLQKHELLVPKEA